MIVGTIPCPMGRPETQEVVHQDNVDNGDCEGEEMVGNGNEEIINEVSEEVNVEIQKEPIVYQRRRFRSQGEQTVAKEPIVYQRRWSQGEQISGPQPQQPTTPVPNHSSDLSIKW